MANTHSATFHDVPVAGDVASSSPARQAYGILHFAFVVAPIIAGLDKFFHLLTNWDMYLAPWIANILPISAHAFMMLVGAIEVIAGLVVAFRPKLGAWIVCAWLLGIIVNLVTYPGYFDIALRDLGLCLGAAALGVLSREWDR